eukprot:346831-Prorocentrum_minimum.AAC.3
MTLTTYSYRPTLLESETRGSKPRPPSPGAEVPDEGEGRAAGGGGGRESRAGRRAGPGARPADPDVLGGQPPVGRAPRAHQALSKTFYRVLPSVTIRAIRKFS